MMLRGRYGRLLKMETLSWARRVIRVFWTACLCLILTCSCRHRVSSFRHHIASEQRAMNDYSLERDGQLIRQRNQSIRRLSKGQPEDTVDDEIEEEKFLVACEIQIGPDVDKGILSPTNYTIFLLDYCSKNAFKGPNCIERDSNDPFNTLPLDFQLLFVSATCNVDDPILQLECLQYLINNNIDEFFFEGQVKEICPSSFSLLKSSHMLDYNQQPISAGKFTRTNTSLHIHANVLTHLNFFQT